MSSPFIGEIRMFAGTFPPSGWAFCNGALMPISENETLFNLIGTTYGGDGQSTFGLPDLQGRVPIHAGSQGGQTFTLGEKAGSEGVNLSVSQIPAHAHYANADGNTVNSSTPASNTVLGTPGAGSTPTYYLTAASTPSPMSTNAIGNNIGSQPITLIQPILVINFIISLYGIFPTQ
jgi:microcystin-dependent protein